MQQLSHDLDCYASCLHRRDAETYSRLSQGQAVQRKNTVSSSPVYSPWGFTGRFPAMNGYPLSQPSVNPTVRVPRPFIAPGAAMKTENLGFYPTFPIPPSLPRAHPDQIIGGSLLAGDSGATVKREDYEQDATIYD